MERLGDIVARVLAGVRVTMEEERAGAVVEAAPEFAARHRGGDAMRAGETGAHPRSSSRRMAKQATGMAAKISIER